MTPKNKRNLLRVQARIRRKFGAERQSIREQMEYARQAFMDNVVSLFEHPEMIAPTKSDRKFDA